MNNALISIILHYSREAKTDNAIYLKTLQSVFNQTYKNIEILLIHDGISTELRNRIEESNTEAAVLHFLKADGNTRGANLNAAFEHAKGSYILLLDNLQNSVLLKSGALDLFLLATGKVKKSGLVYADYELEDNGTVKEVHLLKHHKGRVRDNQDYGKVFFIKKAALEDIGFADTTLSFTTLYDLRLKISEHYDLVHISNRYAGSLYRILASGKGHNVFDYLLASKDSQLEAENVLTEHLKRINAYLAPGTFYKPRPAAAKTATLRASVIIPVNNRPEFIGVAIDSIQAQTVQQVEAVIVVNGGPEDPTISEVKRYMPGGDKYDSGKPQVQLLVYDINNLGLCLNMGADVAQGEYYVQLDSDDRLKPDAVEKILAVYAEDPRIGMVIGSYEVWEKTPEGQLKRMEDLPVVTHDEWTEDNGRNNLLRINGAGAPRSIPIQLIREMKFSVNEEPYARNYGEDYDMVLRLSEKHRVGRVWEAIYEVIRHSGGTDHSIDQATIDRNDEAKDYMRKEAIGRRIRANTG
jgi:glycosyltransferase involved in cell wall biosynthesis